LDKYKSCFLCLSEDRKPIEPPLPLKEEDEEKFIHLLSHPECGISLVDVNELRTCHLERDS